MGGASSAQPIAPSIRLPSRGGAARGTAAASHAKPPRLSPAASGIDIARSRTSAFALAATPRHSPREREATSLASPLAELAALARAELADAVAREDATAQEGADAETTASYAALVQRAVIDQWSRPPSARNGMEALLEVQLTRLGDVVSVHLLRGSGNSAFDRSALNAVEKAAQFPELQQLSDWEFENNFRRFRLLFKPEDLRY